MNSDPTFLSQRAVSGFSRPDFGLEPCSGESRKKVSTKTILVCVLVILALSFTGVAGVYVTMSVPKHRTQHPTIPLTVTDADDPNSYAHKPQPAPTLPLVPPLPSTRMERIKTVTSADEYDELGR